MMTAQPLVKRGQVKLIKDVPGDLPPFYADQEKVRQILLNLLSNAAKFTHEGEIRVEARHEKSKLFIKVIDTGIGLSAGDLERIFEEFQQADSTTTRQYGGTGLGLSISRSLARLMGGDLTAESSEGVGSVFTLSLPWRYGKHYAPESKAAEWSTARLTATDKPIILAIDDNPDVIYILQENLDEAGYLVVGAINGDEGLKKARELRPLAIMLDIMMPHKDGWQVLHELKVDPITKDIPVILLTIVDKKALGYRLGAADYLLKPLDEKQVLVSLERLTRDKDSSLPKRLLVVDDDPQIPDMVRQLLVDMDYMVETAVDGLEALEAIEKEAPDVILLDIMMPKLDGFGLIEKLQEDSVHAGIPIIVLTAKLLTAAETAILQANVAQVMQKQGLAADTLIGEMQKALAEREAA
jgi:CheY-like chemotaxis protein/anti-sigma regulatory factor (Ser/Thr protein kinase)